MVKSGVGVCLIGMAIGSGCLSEGRRADEDAGDTAGDTGAGDTHGGDTGPGDTIGWDADVRPDGEVLECGSCDDQDPCTHDRCNPETGECEHLAYPSGGEPGASGDAAVPVLRECEEDADCDDQDACTSDRCVELGGYCGVGGGTVCAREQVPGCSATCGEGGTCADGDPCTDDVCGADGACRFERLDGCVSQCSKAGLLSLGDALGSGGEARVKTVGIVGPATVGGSCDDGPTCDCTMGASLFGDELELGLLPDYWTYHPGSGGEAAIPSSCETTGCVEVAVGCSPLREGVVFRVWGRPVTGLVPFAAGIAIMPRVEAIDLEGYCLDTEPMSLEGQYEGRLEVAPGVTVTFHVTMVAVDQGVIVEIGRATCATDGCPAWATPDGFVQGTVIEEGDGRIGFLFMAPGGNGIVQAKARLFSNEGAFVGRWEPVYTNGQPAFPPLEQGGSLTLVRLGTGRLPLTGPQP